MQNQPTEPQNEPQNDFWDLGDDDLDPDEAKESSQPKQQSTDSASAQDTPAAPLEEILSDLEDDPLPPALPPQETDPPETTPTPRRYRAKETGREATPTTEIEKIFIGSLLAVLVGLTVWGGYTYVGAAPNCNLAEYKEDFPVQGESITIESVETWWREPVRDGGDPDVGVVVEARLIPCASIKISGGETSTLQVSFRDGEDQLIGDILNLSVSNGKFENGSNEALVYATDGFTNPTTINPYVNQDIAPWTLAIVESADGAEPIVKTRIEANRKEK